jgi:hypothetical protein
MQVPAISCTLDRERTEQCSVSRRSCNVSGTLRSVEGFGGSVGAGYAGRFVLVVTVGKGNRKHDPPE